jgi:hypothetical protein
MAQSAMSAGPSAIEEANLLACITDKSVALKKAR